MYRYSMYLFSINHVSSFISLSLSLYLSLFISTLHLGWVYRRYGTSTEVSSSVGREAHTTNWSGQTASCPDWTRKRMGWPLYPPRKREGVDLGTTLNPITSAKEDGIFWVFSLVKLVV